MKNTIKISKWDSSEYLQTDEDIRLYFQACLEEAGDDAAFIAKALGTIARAKGMTQLAKETGLTRNQLYNTFSEKGNPTLKTMLAVMRAVGLDLTTRQHAHP